MVQPPKELPAISTLPKSNDKVNTQSNVQNNPITLKTELPNTTFAQKHQIQPSWDLPSTQNMVISTIEDSSYKSYSKPKDSEMLSFDEAIKSIHKEITESTSSNHSAYEERNQNRKEEKPEYYTPKNVGEGYFAQIQQYLQSRDPNELADDILKKDFLTGMKDYHNLKSEGKPFYLHKSDLLDKLEQKTNELAQKEQEWHQLKVEMEEIERKRMLIEKDVDQEAMELKNLFYLVKTDQILNIDSNEKEQFVLRSGQKIKNLNELRKALSYMTDEEFLSYTQNENHISNWTNNCLKLPDIALKIKEMKTRQELEKFLSKPIN